MTYVGKGAFFSDYPDWVKFIRTLYFVDLTLNIYM